MKEAIKNWWLRQKAKEALSELEYLERRRKWIDPFFMGETKYEIELAKWSEKKKQAAENWEALKHYL